MKALTAIVLACFLGVMMACGTTGPGPDETALRRSMLGQTLTEESIARAIVTGRAIFPYHFATGTTAINELGRRDLRVLAAHFKRYPPTKGEIIVKKIVKNYRVYFDFDEWNIRLGDENVLEEAARLLRQNTADHVLITGNTDARGTEEYNLRLGERRAESVRQSLLDKDIDFSRIQILSQGEYSAIRPESEDVELMQSDRNAHFMVGEVVTEVTPAQVHLSVRQETASRSLYLARKEAVVDFLVDEGIDRDMIAIDDAPAGGDGMASHRVLAVVSGMREGQGSGGQPPSRRNGQSSSQQGERTTNVDSERGDR